MNIDVFELVPDNDKPRKDCSHLVAISASIECDIEDRTVVMICVK